MQQPHDDDDEAPPGGNDGDETEETPLAPSGTTPGPERRRRRSRRRRPPSLAGRILYGAVRRAFSVSNGTESNGNDDDDGDEDEYEWNPNRPLHDDGDGEDGGVVRSKSAGRPCCRRVGVDGSVLILVACSAAVSLLVVLLFLLLPSSPARTDDPSRPAGALLCPEPDGPGDGGGGSVFDLDGLFRSAPTALKRASSREGLPHGAVASDHPVCSAVGRDVMELRGGNAVDAAVATVLCLGVANPASSGLGGGAFLLIRANRTHFEERQSERQSRMTSGGGGSGSGSGSNTSGAGPDFIDARDGDDDAAGGDDGPYMTEVIDCREAAPGRASRDMYEGLPESASAVGGLAVAVPGELRGLELAHSRHGRLPWRDVVEPARRLATEGVAVGRHLAGDIKLVMTVGMPSYGDSPSLRRHLTTDGDPEKYLREGDVLTNAGLGRTLRAVAEGGADALYRGERAETIARDVRARGGVLTAKDLEEYMPILRSPIHADVSGFTVVGIPPPSSGGAVLIGAARFLSGYAAPLAAEGDTLSVHRTVEAMRHAFSIRMSLSDPDYDGTNVTRDAVHDLLRGGYMESLRRLTRDDGTLPLSQYGGAKWAQLHDADLSTDAKDAHEGDRRHRQLRDGNQPRKRRLARPFGYLDDSGTSHVSVVDSEGNAVSVTSSVNGLFGSWVFSEKTGVSLGNTMDDFGVPGRANFFGLQPSEANFIAPGKRVRNVTNDHVSFERRPQKSK